MGKQRAEGNGKELPTSTPEIYVERGGIQGRALGYWLQAAAELRTKRRNCRFVEAGKIEAVARTH